MELIDQVRSIIKNLNLEDPIIDLNYDKQGNIVGYVADPSFQSRPTEEVQKMLWKALKDNLPQKDFLRIIALFHEAPSERLNRLSDKKQLGIELPFSKFWLHKTPDFAKYWMFIDVARLGDEYEAFYLILCEKFHIEKGTKLHYDQEVISFMELSQDEIYKEVYTNIFGLGEVEVQTDIMNRYEKLSQEGLFGAANPYFYVYASFKMEPYRQGQILFSASEIQMIQKHLTELKNFSITDELDRAIKKSKKIIESKENL